MPLPMTMTSCSLRPGEGGLTRGLLTGSMYTLLTSNVSSVNSVVEWAMAKARTRSQGSYHHGNLSDALVQAALELVEAEEVSKLSLRAVARHAGVSPAAPYRHFESREALLAFISTQGFHMRTEAMQEALAQCEDEPRLRLLEVGNAFVLFAHHHPAHYAVMTSPDLHDDTAYPELAAAGVTSMKILLDAIEACAVAGDLTGDVRVLAAAAWSGVHGLASLLASGHIHRLGLEAETTEDLIRQVTGAMLSAMSQAGPGRV